ncbi:hypothetical protein FGG08_003012 [Glutinoglossum americanum]|uniref:IPT/TIG domain-containing protein n=1 Tax=Glutinoglossum americanum TaxID=1670608 RepID=A0A9P8I584_9PEZI|nr:hypothetical protein FGG08_003012 [Glutinoglossum americanum]
MGPTEDPMIHCGRNSPQIVDPDDMGGILQDSEEFFIPNATPISSGLLEDGILDSAMNFSDFGSLQGPTYMPSVTFTPNPQTIPTSLIENGNNCQQISPPSSASPASSSQDSSSDSSRHHKRKSSSNSSHSGLAGADSLTIHDRDPFNEITMSGDGSGFADYSGLVDFSSIGGPNHQMTLPPDVEMSNRDMENHFDFESAASSPSPLDMASANNRHTRAICSSFPGRRPPQSGNRYQLDGKPPIRRKNGSPGGAFAIHGVRETSPLSAMIMSHDSSPSALFDNHSPPSDAGTEFLGGPMLSGSSQDPKWPTSFSLTDSGAPNPSSHTQLPPTIANNLASPFSPAKPLPRRGVTHTLTIHPTPLKSRVETQIPIRMTLHPIPTGVTKLHLPTHTISKPKLLAKPHPSRSPDTLELHTMLVCTSAMQNPGYLDRALARASRTEVKQEIVSRSPSQDGRSDMSEDDESKPSNGGEVKICCGCITRERKRAARKKVKKVDEEESWYRDEQKRVIVFNTHEIKDWQQPTRELSVESGTESTPPLVPSGAMQVEAPMRIACYCRHQNEKLGFQVIFTIKDYNDNLVAQAITPSIMITDDHKTHAPPNTQAINPPDSNLPASDSGAFSNCQGFQVSPGAPISMPQFRLSHSTSDLQSMSFQQQFPPASTPYTAPQAYSVSHTPRNTSRQTSVSGPSGHSAKKRKANSSGKVPTGLAMTRLETEMGSHNLANAGPPSTTPSSATSPFFPNAYSIPAENSYIQSPLMPSQFHTGPPTPNSNDRGLFTPAHRSQSLENLPMHPLFSATNSSHPSRPHSPNNHQQNGTTPVYHQAQAQMAQAVANGLYGLPLALNPHRPPVIHKLIPNEGPKAGGIEVTCLGSGFCQGLEVYFGENLATTTTYWGDTSLVCLLPPALHAGTVTVTFKHDQQPLQPYPISTIQKQHVYFKYVDDDEQQLLRLALSVVGQKMTGKLEDVRDIARRIVGSSGNSPWDATAGSASSAGQQRPASAFDASMLGFMDLESALLKCLDLIDMDDSPNQARLNLRRGSGQTMLHLACSLGFYRFVAALLARGANPEPRDKGGYTPMHYAAMHNQPQIVRRLILSGADPTMRTLQGYTPADLTTSEEVLVSARGLGHHSRHRSGGSLRSKTSSTASLRSLWETTPRSHAAAAALASSGFAGSDADDNDGQDHDNDIDSISETDLWMRSKRSSRRMSMAADAPPMGDDPSRGVPQTQRGVAATPAMVAWRQQLATHFQHLQQLWNLPNLPNLPQIPPMPALPDYQNYLGNRMGRLNSLVPLRSPSRSGASSGSESQAAKEADYRWWELFSVPSAPPAYEEIFPQSEPKPADQKIVNVAQAAVDAYADQKCAEAFDYQTAKSSSTGGRSSPTIELRIDGLTITKEAQEELRAAHARKLKKIKSDRNLFFVWIPLLVIILVAMLKNRVPQVWDGALKLYSYIRNKNSERVVEVAW